MKQLKPLLGLLASLALAACGGSGSGSDDAFRPGTPPSATPPPPAVGSLVATSSQTSVTLDGTQTAEIRVVARDASNVALAGVPVTFSASGGSLEVRQGTTTSSAGGSGGATGGSTTPAAVAVLSGVGATAGPITVTATAAGASGNVTTTVQVAAVASQPPVAVGSLTLSTSTPTIPSDDQIRADITAIVRDTSNRFLANVPVTFTASSGGLEIVSGTSNASGVATARLGSAADPTNRTITVQATAQSIQQTITISVTGTRLTIQGPAALVLGQTGTYTVSLTDAGDRGIAGRTITLSSARGNTLSAPSIVTDTTGRGTVNVTITQPGAETLTATGLGITSTQAIAVNADSFTITTPAADNLEVPLGTAQPITVRWLSGGAPVVGQPVTFATTRGTLSAPTVNTDASGNATVTVSSTTAGGAAVTASGSGAATTQRLLEFIATVPASVSVQASTFTVAPTEQATITAIVRDAANNLVKNATVTFNLTDITGGTLQTASAVTNSQGRAQTVYTAGSTPGPQNGVNITARAGGVQGAVQLTVAQRALFLSLGTGNTIREINQDSQYQLDYAIQVTDANGNGVPNVPLTITILSLDYLKGRRAFVSGGPGWSAYASPFYVCADEDANRNGVLDPGEDFNNSTRLEAGNVALVSPRNAVTNDQGVATVAVVYPQEFAYWLDVRLEVSASVGGTETRRSTQFRLPGAASDFNTQTTAPPGPVSPFGVNPCNIAN